MTAKTRADIQTEINSLLADNTTADISPADVRTVHETSKDSNLNLLETTAQTVIGTVNYSGDLRKSGKSIVPVIKAVVVNVKADFPAPSAGVITLAANTTYLMGDDVNVGTDRFVFSDRSVLSGFESLNITLTYTGTGDLFTMVDTTNRVNNMFISAVNGRIFNWTSTSGLELRVTDVQSTSGSYGIFNGSSSILRFTNISPVMATDGLEFQGSWASVLWEVSGAAINGGIFFDLGTATFRSFIIDKILMTLAGGTTFFSGLTGSANIQAGGIGTIINTRINGAGTSLAGITTSDALWEFFHNDDIADTRPDGLLSLQGNAVNTVIASFGTPVLIAGTWVVERTSQFTGTTGGRLTYDGGKDITIPITGSITIVPVSGGAVNVSVEVAVDGVVIPNSKRTASASSGNPTSITVPWQEVLSTSGFGELFVTNEDSAVDLLVSSAILRVN